MGAPPALTADVLARFIKNGGAGAATAEKTVSLSDPDTPQTYTLGGSSDLWGATWTAEEINAMIAQVRATLGTGASAVFGIDSISITIAYTEPSGLRKAATLTLGMQIGL